MALLVDAQALFPSGPTRPSTAQPPLNRGRRGKRDRGRQRQRNRRGDRTLLFTGFRLLEPGLVELEFEIVAGGADIGKRAYTAIAVCRDCAVHAFRHLGAQVGVAGVRGAVFEQKLPGGSSFLRVGRMHDMLPSCQEGLECNEGQREG